MLHTSDREWAEDYDCPTIRCRHGRLECVAYTSTDTPRLLLSEVPRPEEKDRKKVAATGKLIKRKN